MATPEDRFGHGGDKIPVPLPSDTRYKAEGDKLLDEGFHQIITGQRPIGYFEELVSQWNAIGGSQLTEEANASTAILPGES